jgi:phosphoglucomutase
MTGDFVRDKDSCGSIVLACEIAAWCKANGRTMYQYLIEIYQETGMYYEGLVNLVRKGKDGAEEILNMMKNFRENPPKSLAGSPVEEVKDFKEQTNFIVSKNEKKVMDDIPKSNVLIYYTQDGTKVCVRPSGTEPKIKFYISVKDDITSEADFRDKLKSLEAKIQEVRRDLQLN